MSLNNDYYILTINPGSTSTKIGIFFNEDLRFKMTISHNDREISSFKRVWDQYNYRKKAIINAIGKKNFEFQQLNCVVGRGGLFRPTVSGTYTINKKMLADARISIQGEHASNLGCVLAFGIAWEYNIPSFIVDPPSVDEMEDVARISGHVAFKRKSLVHALNIKAIARASATKLNKNLDQVNLIVAHLGGGISITPLKKGRMIDTSEALNSGPFTPERAGYMPTIDLVEYVLTHNLSLQQTKKMLVGGGGMYSYLKTKNLKLAEEEYQKGNPKFQLIVEAMAYQISKEIGAMATALKGDLDAIVLTGGAAHSQVLVNLIKERTTFLVKKAENILVFPGEDELKALAEGALRVLRNKEKPLSYPQAIDYKDWFKEENTNHNSNQ